MNLGIIVNKQELVHSQVQLVIPQEALVNIKQPSPLFDYESVPGMWLIPITIPYRENAEKLGLPAEVSIIDKPIEYACKVVIADTWIIDGTLMVMRCNRNMIEISAACPYYDMSEELFNSKIRDLSWDDVLLVDPEPQIYIDIEFTLIGAEGDDTITINTSYAEYEYTKLAATTTSIALVGVIDLINADTGDSGISAEVIGGNTIRLKQDALGTHNNVFDTAAIFVTTATYTVTLDFMTWLTDWHDDCRPAMDAIAESGNIYPDNTVVFPNVMNKWHFGDLNADFTGWINHYLINQYFINYTSTQSFLGNKYAVVPFVFALTVLKKIFDNADIAIDGNAVTEERFRRIIIDNNYSIGKEWYDPEGDQTILVVADRIKIANHIPDITVGEFITGYRNKFNLYLAYDPLLRQVKFINRNDVVDLQKQNNWNNKPHMSLPVNEFAITNGITFTSPVDDTDEYANSHVLPYDNERYQGQDYVIGNGKTTVSSIFGCPSVYRVERFAGSAKLKTPYKYRLGYGDEWEKRRNEYGTGFLIYKGIVADSNGEDYVYATNDHLDENDEDDGSNISLQWDKIYDLFFDTWLDFYINSAVTRITLEVPISELVSFKFDEFYGLLQQNFLAESWEISDVSGSRVMIEFVLRRRKNFLT